MFQPTQLKNDLREAIVKTIAFFDLFDYPLTVYEIHKYSDKRVPLAEIINILNQETNQGKDLIREKNGFYFLADREAIITIRQKNYNYSIRKVKIARRFSHLVRLCPFIHLIAVANLIGNHNLRDGSDIDFFIITAARRLWLSRLYCAGLAKILRLRPTARNKKDKICLSFYVSVNHLNLDDLKLSGADPYFDYWRRGLILLYNKREIYTRFLKENGLIGETDITQKLPIQEFNGSKQRSNIFFDFLEKIAKSIQLKIMPSVLKAAVNSSDGVVINDTVLKLYLSDRRREYAEKYENKISEILSKNN